MEQFPFISIIMPTFNRAYFIGETLESIISQSYKNWECLVVDDGSDDDTSSVLKKIIEVDDRVKYHTRPKNKPKGANSCRNYGLELSKGDFVLFFDSDDLMYPNKIEVSLDFLNKNKADYVITKTIDFNHPNKDLTFISQPLNYNFNDYQLNHYNYACQYINWLTPDALINSKLAKKIKFNEALKRGQEYNYYVKLTLESENGAFLDEFTTIRRLHSNSIKSQYNKNDVIKHMVELRMLTFIEIYSKTQSEVKNWFIKDITINGSRFVNPLSLNHERLIINYLFNHFGVKAMFYYTLTRISKKVFKRGEYFRQKFKKCLK